LDLNIYEDDGPGMSQAVKAKVFQPFFTTKDPGDGTGLGLSLSHSIILEHGGSIEVESQPGAGANFIVELPLTQATDVREVMPIWTQDSPGSNRKAHILVVDDEANIRSLVKNMLTHSGHSVEISPDAEDALKKLDSATFDVLFLDIRMPGMSGTDLYGIISVRWPEMAKRVVFMTGDTSDSAVRQQLMEKAVPFIMKPFDRAILEKEIYVRLKIAGRTE